jgi:hypothetical protein
MLVYSFGIFVAISSKTIAEVSIISNAFVRNREQQIIPPSL